MEWFSTMDSVFPMLGNPSFPFACSSQIGKWWPRRGCKLMMHRVSASYISKAAHEYCFNCHIRNTTLWRSAFARIGIETTGTEHKQGSDFVRVEHGN